MGLDFFSGIPDSTFKTWMTFLDHEHGKKLQNIIACNECEAVAIVTGYHLATGKIGVVYMQNAGEGKTVNPLVSLCHPEVYSIPLFLMIGWRGEPGEKDEPQHQKMGKITIPLLELLDIPYKILPDSLEEAESRIQELIEIANTEKKPVALIIKRGILEKGVKDDPFDPVFDLNREDAIHIIMNNLLGSEIIISTTGKTSRELFEYRISRGETPRDFYTVGGMGCAASIALGVALQNSNKKVIILDGDGSLLMQMGSMATIGHYAPENLYHILIDNRSHDSTGGQPTVSKTVKFEEIARACGYKSAKTLRTEGELSQCIREINTEQGSLMIIVNVNKGARNNLGRPTTTPIQNKKEFMKLIRN
jgi:phosphonopyruvate decarboxylase